jgi:hypothetical protein
MNYLKSDYAKKKGVLPARISQLKAKGVLILTTDKETGREMVVDCKQNDNLFKNKAWNRKRK